MSAIALTKKMPTNANVAHKVSGRGPTDGNVPADHHVLHRVRQGVTIGAGIWATESRGLFVADMSCL